MYIPSKSLMERVYALHAEFYDRNYETLSIRDELLDFTRLEYANTILLMNTKISERLTIAGTDAIRTPYIHQDEFDEHIKDAMPEFLPRHVVTDPVFLHTLAAELRGWLECTSDKPRAKKPWFYERDGQTIYLNYDHQKRIRKKYNTAATAVNALTIQNDLAKSC